MLLQEFAIVCSSETFQHTDARRADRVAMTKWFAQTIVLDLSRARDATTAAFADLVLLRRKLLSDGRDLRLSGLQDRAAKVYHVNRLNEVLPLR
jgi:anti-anti-sigma regulatory factor